MHQIGYKFGTYGIVRQYNAKNTWLAVMQRFHTVTCVR